MKLDVLYGPEVTVPSQKEVEHGQEVIVNCEVSANHNCVNQRRR